MLIELFVSPSGIVQVEKESFIPEFGENLIVVPVHVACSRGEEIHQICIVIVNGLVIM